MTDICRRSAIRLATREAGIASWSSDIAPVRGKCRGRVKRKPCGSRWAVPRVSLDFRDPERVDRLAILECVSCGRKWRRIKPPAVRSSAGYQSVRLDVILPATANRWYSRGAWHREGEDALILRDADLGDVDEAARAHSAHLSARLASKARDRERREAADREATARGMAALAAHEARRAADAADEAAAAAREAAYA
jgi:hypothetical protein